MDINIISGYNYYICTRMLKEKQDYLYTQIIEADYDPESFQEFIDNRRGINLDLYTLQELV